MASANLTGSARFTFTPGSSGLTSPFLLAVPLSPLPDFQIEDQRLRFSWRSADRSARAVVVFPTDKSDLFAAVRFDDEPDDLRKLLRLTMDGVIADLKYHPTSGHAGVDVEVESFGRLVPDGSRGGMGEFRTDVHLVLATSDLDEELL